MRIEQFANRAREDDLALCTGVELTDLFRTNLLNEFSMATSTPVGTTDLVVGGNMGCTSLDDELDELNTIRQMVIDERTYQNFLDAELAECTG